MGSVCVWRWCVREGQEGVSAWSVCQHPSQALLSSHASAALA